MVILKSGMSVWVAMVVSSKTAAFSCVIPCSLVNCNQYTENKLKRRFSIVSALWTGSTFHTTLAPSTNCIVSCPRRHNLIMKRKYASFAKEVLTSLA